MDYAISIIVPIFNSEKYLKACLDSVFSQSIANKEIILIDDCSTDRSIDIIKCYQVLSDAVQIIRNPLNKGLSNSRNLGLRVARGKYVGFVDSDDFVIPDMFENLVRIGNSGGLDIVMSNYKYVLENGETHDYRRTERIYKLGIVSGKTFLEESINDKCLPAGGNCSNIYLSEFLTKRQIKFKPDTYFEDVTFQLDTLIDASKVQCLKETYYYYLKRENSITSSYNPKKISDHFAITRDIYKKFKELVFLKPVIYDLYYASLVEPTEVENRIFAAAIFKKQNVLYNMISVSTNLRQFITCLCIAIIGPLAYCNLRKKRKKTF